MSDKTQPTNQQQLHPILEEFLETHPVCDDDIADRAFLVYHDLTETRGWWSTTLTFSEALGRPYIIGQRDRVSQRQAVLPMSSDETLSMVEIQQLLVGVTVDDMPQTNVTLAVSEPDSTTVYYKLTSGLCPPDAPETAASYRTEFDRKTTRRRRHLAKCVRMANERLAQEGE